MNADAGADCLHAPGITDLSAIRTVVSAVAPKPVNLLLIGPNMRVAELAEQTTGGNRLRSRPFGHRRSERNAPTFCIIHYQTVPSAVQDDPDHKTFFLHNDELYERAKKRGEPFNEFAVIALAQIHHISDVPAHADREANVQVMHDLLPWGEN